MHKDLGVGSHGEFLDRHAFPHRELGAESHRLVLEDAQGEGAESIVRFNTGAIPVVDSDACVRVADISHLGVEKQAGVIPLQERGGLALDDGTVSARISDEEVVRPKLAKGKGPSRGTEAEGALPRRGGTFHV